MSVFLSTFVDVINKLTSEGISCNVKNKNKVLKLHVLTCCVDSVARAPVQGIKQFNGKYGCSWCLHPGEWAEGSMRYPLLTYYVNDRDHEKTVNDMLHATPDNPINGIKYPSPLINFPKFNIILGFTVDYLHCCLEGVASQFTEYHLQSMSKDDIEELDEKINKITAPHQISRLSRPISIRKDWKAREWEHYVLFYSVPLLADHLSRNHLFHWLLFVKSLNILLQSSIHIRELDRADQMLHEFVAKSQEYFGIKSMTFNVHQLLHISKTVLNWGPLWCQSTFSFESANQNLFKAIQCSKGVTLQIVRFININHFISVVQEYVYPHADVLVKMYCDDFLGSKVQNTCKIRDITYFGLGNRVPNDILEKLQLSEHSANHF
ncbi:uncharacterized protein LOC107981308 isoform X1 [Nasonia vitripennis]|uniref:Uncharacterized protein n=1 Tax=Nasonia vitripennis TaxID=7425 RepID=A0A7M7PU10_NASVI|nr:uncharacterized protein LOC107981308 isoform X1 [Nasonia vitripennis]